MNNYTYSEIQTMQKKAMDRVKEMQKNSERVLSSAQREFSSDNLNMNKSPTIKSKVTNLPPNFPEKKVYPDFKEFFKDTTERVMPQTPKAAGNILENLLNEPDRAILLGLIMLLKSEGADEMLILALMYILS